jgi:hypothetical protein
MPAKGSRRSCNEQDYQTKFSVFGNWEKVNYGEFLGNWQACLAWLREVECSHDTAFVTSHFARPAVVKQYEEAMGFESSLVVRFGSMGVADPFAHLPSPNHYYAMSATLAPTQIQFHSKVVYAHPDVKSQLQGVLPEPADTLKDHLPDEVAEFLERKPTVVVSVSSFGQVNNIVRMFPSSDTFQVLFLGSSCRDPDPHHMHYEGLVDLDAAFDKAALIVHGCGVGTVNQVALSGKPSIGLSGFLEQKCNGLALERLGISKHFTLESLYTDPGSVKCFAASISSFFDGTASLADPSKLREVQHAVRQESAAALGNFCRRLRKVLESQPARMPQPVSVP